MYDMWDTKHSKSDPKVFMHPIHRLLLSPRGTVSRNGVASSDSTTRYLAKRYMSVFDRDRSIIIIFLLELKILDIVKLNISDCSYKTPCHRSDTCIHTNHQ